MLDALGTLEPEPFEDVVWRVVRDGRRPLEAAVVQLTRPIWEVPISFHHLMYVKF